VELAKKRLQSMNPNTVGAIRSKQAARLVLSKEAELVKAMVHEGLLSSSHAEEFLEEIGHDTDQIERDRNRMYRRKSGDSAEAGRESLWSWFGFSVEHSLAHDQPREVRQPLVDSTDRY
jgi:hypothetical protein